MIFFEQLMRDFRHNTRRLIKSPSVSVVVILTLAVGIGLNTAIFSLVNGVLLRPLPYSDPGKLVSIWQLGAPLGAYVGLQTRSKTMDIATFTTSIGFNLVLDSGDAVRLAGSETSDNFFSILGARPYLGRGFMSGENLPSSDKLVILSYKIWQQQFHGDTQIVGHWTSIDGVKRQIVGIMPPDFAFPASSTALWIPAEINPSDPRGLWAGFGHQMIARLRPGVTVGAARAEFGTVVPQVVKTFPWKMPDGWGMANRVVPLQEYVVGDFRAQLLILLVAVCLIQMIACANVANILLSRSSVRQKEISVRLALGAERKRVISQLLSESILLSLCGSALGIMLALVGLKAFKSIFPVGTPRLDTVTVDGFVLFAMTLLGVITGVVFGLVPAFAAASPNVAEVLNSAGAKSSKLTPKQGRFSAGLVITEIAFATILVCGAGLLVKTMWTISQLHPGFERNQLVMAHVTPSVSFCSEPGRCQAFYETVLTRLRALPGVSNVALADVVPFNGIVPLALAADGSNSAGSVAPQAWEFSVSPDYLDTMKMQLLKGRFFTTSERAGGPGVVVVSNKLAQRLWPGKDPLGKLVKPSWMPQWRTVIGVVDDVHEYALSQESTRDVAGDIYFPLTQGIAGQPLDLMLIARTENPEAFREELPKIVSTVSAAVPLSEVKTMNEAISNSVSTSRATMWLFGIFAGSALILGGIGVYGIVSYATVQRTQEIGIRMALGASKYDILRMVLQKGSLLILTGALGGILGGFLLTRFLASQLFHVSPTDPSTFILVAITVAMVALFAMIIPTRKAISVDPNVALHHE